MQTRTLPYVGLAALKIVSKSLPESLGGKALRREFARKLVSMRGLPMKMAQILSMSKDDAVALLQKEALSEVKSAPRNEVLARLKILSPELLQSVNHFSEEAVVASLGQVHKLTLQDGRICALKIRHAGIGAAMDLDTSLMDFLISVFGQFRNGFSMDEYQKLLNEELAWELDYPYECKRQSVIFAAFDGIPRIIIPKPYPFDSGKEHLVMDWEESQPIEKFAQGATELEKQEALDLLTYFHFHTLFHAKMAHADPNPGNFGLRRGPLGIELVVYDYGSLVPINSEIVAGLLNLITSMRIGGDLMKCLLDMKFIPEPLVAIEDKLGPLCEILLEPFIHEGEFRVSNWNRSQRVKMLLGGDRWNLMIAAPPNLFFVIRALHGLFHYSEILGVPLKCFSKMGPYLDLQKAIPIPELFSKIELDAEHPTSKLHIELSKHGEKMVSLVMPGDAVNRLESIMDAELVGNLMQNGIDVNQITEMARRNNFKAMLLLEQEYGEKKVKIYLV